MASEFRPEETKTPLPEMKLWEVSGGMRCFKSQAIKFNSLLNIHYKF